MVRQYNLLTGDLEDVSKICIFPNSLEKINVEHIALSLLRNEVKKQKVSPNYRGLCIFHQEKTPSFYLRPKKNDYRCFGCVHHGGPIMLLNKITTNPPWVYLNQDWGMDIGEEEFNKSLLEEGKWFEINFGGN